LPIPYRDSKLTQILKESLGGNMNTFIISTISENLNYFEESRNTLKFAENA
jgi:kinesin family protein 4/21/27